MALSYYTADTGVHVQHDGQGHEEGAHGGEHHVALVLTVVAWHTHVTGVAGVGDVQERRLLPEPVNQEGISN